jgi:transcriptional regulator with XRE-family HTH domain
MDDFWQAEIGPRIRQAREDAKLTQAALAKLIDRTTGTISNYERGERAPWEEIRQIAEATNADLRWLLFGSSYQDPLDRIERRLDGLARALEDASAQALGGGPIQGLEALVRSLRAEQQPSIRKGPGSAGGTGR